MSQKKPNDSIHCSVSSCAYNCGDEKYCSLRSIRVEPCGNGGNGKPSDESMCGSYNRK